MTIELPEDFRDLLIELHDAAAARVYRALAAFGAPLERFELTEADFASYDGVLQIGLPPRRVDILNRADGISFDEAIADGATFELEGRRIPVIGLAALVKNKRASTREQTWRTSGPSSARRARGRARRRRRRPAARGARCGGG